MGTVIRQRGSAYGKIGTVFKRIGESHCKFALREQGFPDHVVAPAWDDFCLVGTSLSKFLLTLVQVDDFAPKKSIVITPLKMAAYYGAYPIDREMHSYTCRLHQRGLAKNKLLTFVSSYFQIYFEFSNFQTLPRSWMSTSSCSR
jgi:hypothetical protein